MITVIGAGLAGCEAAWQIAEAGYHVTLCEMKPEKHSPAHHSDDFAELVCSNSLKAARLDSAAGLLKAEMELLGSLTVPCAKATAVEAGGALAVDRHRFSKMVTEKIRNHPNITVLEQEITKIPDAPAVIATGPLTSDALADEIASMCGGALSFFDAAAPIVTFESLDQSRIFFASRYGRGEADYINCPMNREEYEAFYDALIHAERAEQKAFEKDSFRVYEGCMPIEVLASRGADTMRFGPMKPVGLTDPHTGRRPYAVVQLRKENRIGSMYNLVGFQTNLKFGEQKRVFSMIPGLEHAEFVRYGVMHRNSFLDSPRLLNSDFSLKSTPMLFFAGQMTGVEGYMESAGSGILAGKNLVRKLRGEVPITLPRETMLGALSRYISDPFVENFQPMGANMGILPDLPDRVRDKKLKYGMLAERSMAALRDALGEQTDRKAVEA
ncbi:MAG: methylenetetrahydrofolate--tRNA-(uracil(54)-C(5))-methyltransferase (FADH(2)-oxidizing) TrmFO [Ruminococcus sp.]|nr:methylenetetrahydrofolate--tRNA-(uracil(54)-C(5))-methyltransferase (FADH(2)-oxidizing) TrmFO [Ruminococcus sp.]